MAPAPQADPFKAVKDVIAGTCGGIAVTMVGHPFDTVKVRLQTQPTANPVYSGALDCVRKTLASEGVAGLYKGVASPLAGQMVFRATLFGAFGAAKRWLSGDGARPLTDADYFKAGAMTGFVAAFAEGPIDFYKSQIQVQAVRARADPSYVPPYTTVSGCVKATLAASGLRGPFQGLGVTLARNTPANAIYLGSFEALKDRAAARAGCAKADLPALTVVGAAGVGGLLYWLAIFPVDVIKSAIQSDAITPSQRRFSGPLDAARALWAEGGAARFYRGFAPCLLRAVPANGVMLLTVDKVTAMLNKQQQQGAGAGAGAGAPVAVTAAPAGGGGGAVGSPLEAASPLER